MNDATAADTLGALAHATRLAILRLLVRAGPNGLAAGQITETLALSPSLGSFHLSAMAKAGVLIRRRAAQLVVYAVDFPALGGLLGHLVQECCAGAPEIVACCGRPRP